MTNPRSEIIAEIAYWINDESELKPYVPKLAQNSNGMDYCSSCEQAWDECSCSARNRGKRDERERIAAILCKVAGRNLVSKRTAELLASRDRLWLEKIVPKEMVFNYHRPGKDPKTGQKRGWHQCQGWNDCLAAIKQNYERSKHE